MANVFHIGAPSRNERISSETQTRIIGVYPYIHNVVQVIILSRGKKTLQSPDDFCYSTYSALQQ